jgi:hypothetical protein
MPILADALEEAGAMTEQEWLECADPMAMVKFLRGKASDRKLRLFACACCRRIWHLLTDERSRMAVEVAERHADGSATPKEVKDASDAAWKVEHFFGKGFEGRAAGWATSVDPIEASYMTIDSVLDTLHSVAARCSERAAQCTILRDIFGDLFQPVPPDPLWLISKAVVIAQAIYDERTYDRLPILADALEQAGCHDANILNHCRQHGGHVRGCWVVDLVLGRSKAMTEQDWLQCTDPRPMLELVITKASNRLRRLLAVACCRRVLPLVQMSFVSNAVDVAERLADGLAGVDDVCEAEEAVKAQWLKANDTDSGYIMKLCCQAVGCTVHHAKPHALLAASTAADVAMHSLPKSVDGSGRIAARTAEMVAQCNLVRDIFQNPFRSVSIDRASLTPNAVHLANMIYNDRAYDRLPVLADSLEEAGCDNEEILSHCRQPGVHVLGCWALDLILGKE